MTVRARKNDYLRGMNHEEAVIIRLTREADLARLDEIYASARRFMRAGGNMLQWPDGGGYPSSVTARADMARGWSRVVEAGGRVVATFCLMDEPEPTYASLAEASAHYVTLHRVASDGTLRGVFALAADYALRTCGCNVMVDTHADNGPMLAAIARAGFAPCGPIVLADGSPRLAFIRRV